MSWFLLIRPRRRRWRASATLLARSRAATEVVTVGGIYGTIVGLDGDEVRLEIADDVVIRVARRAVAGHVGTPPAAPAEDPTRSPTSPTERVRERRDLRRDRTTSMGGRVTDRTKNRLILLAMLVLLALTGVVAGRESPVLGLDLEGGLEVVLEAARASKKRDGRRRSTRRSDHPRPRRRARRGGAGDPQGGRQPISVALAGDKDPKAARDIIGSTGKLYFLDLEGRRSSRSSRRARPATASYRADAVRAAEGGRRTGRTRIPTTARRPSSVRVRQEDAPTRRSTTIRQPSRRESSKQQLEVEVLKTKAADAVLLRAPAGTLWAAPVAAPTGDADDAQHRYWYMFGMPTDKDLVAVGRDVRDAQGRLRPADRPPIVTMDFDATAARRSRRSRTTSPSAAGAPDRSRHRGRLAALRGHPRQQARDLRRRSTYERKPGRHRGGNAQITGLDGAARPRTSRSCCSRARCRSSSSTLSQRRSRRRSARTRCARA